MLRAGLGLLVALSLPAPVLGQTLRESAAAAAREASLVQPTRGPMSPALKWTGITLLAGGAGLIVGGIAKDNGCVDEEFAGIPIVDQDCKDQAKAFQILGGLVAGTGAGLLLIGALKRESAPSITFNGRGVQVSQRITF
jgi:hypothetical protein